MAIEIKATKNSGSVIRMFEDANLNEALDYADELNKQGYEVAVINHKGVSLNEYVDAISESIRNHVNAKETDLKLN